MELNILLLLLLIPTKLRYIRSIIADRNVPNS